MTRIFPTLASLSLGLFVASVVIGLAIGNLYDNPTDATLRLRGVHMLTGTSAALAVVFVHSIVVTYFIGTSRWCKEVTETYRLDPGPLRRSTMLKRRTFPWCVLGMLAVVAVGALGAASDPGTGRPNTADMASVHLVAALVGLVFVAWTYFQAWQNIADNQNVIQEIVAMVARIRRERGLDEDPAMASVVSQETASSTP
jgi:protein-S-isoprenylcysteine O-methyltransferase Ste14